MFGNHDKWQRKENIMPIHFSKEADFCLWWQTQKWILACEHCKPIYFNVISCQVWSNDEAFGICFSISTSQSEFKCFVFSLFARFSTMFITFTCLFYSTRFVLYWEWNSCGDKEVRNCVVWKNIRITTLTGQSVFCFTEQFFFFRIIIMFYFMLGNIMSRGLGRMNEESIQRTHHGYRNILDWSKFH